MKFEIMLSWTLPISRQIPKAAGHKNALHQQTELHHGIEQCHKTTCSEQYEKYKAISQWKKCQSIKKSDKTLHTCAFHAQNTGVLAPMASIPFELCPTHCTLSNHSQFQSHISFLSVVIFWQMPSIFLSCFLNSMPKNTYLLSMHQYLKL